ncbi:M3 family metallopeptidase [Marinimicrobium sp. ABcell2]|uniref:M3 family metallopeptidase n=1 Tax=Marinimicrobium sp. ABcell2 TaxID=3069751 RepID=UPI0027B82712|nr:M3 family metallopeptidase [Marinimicrobium sp. ABcell2]MDQ2077884.1 M3 family metallopeptidase [Marinimicrobium sp. ABcell2]
MATASTLKQGPVKLAGIWVAIACLTLVACGQQPAQPDAPEDPKWPQFEDEDAQAYIDQCQANLEAAQLQFASLETSPTPMTDAVLLEQINKLDIMTNRIAGSASLYRNVHPNPQVRAAADTCQQNLVPLGTDIGLSRPLYQRVNEVDLDALDALDQRFVEDMLLGFQRAGVDRPEVTRQRIRELNGEINKLGQQFNAHIREDVRKLEVESADRLAGLPQDYIDARVQEDGTVVITTDYPDYFPVMQYAEDDQLRYELYKLFRQRGYPQNDKVLHELLTARHELATLLGYRHYAHFVTEDKMIETPEHAQVFIDRISAIADSRARYDYEILLARQQEIDPTAQVVGDWQKTHLEELIKQELFDIDSREIRSYFQYDRVRQGIFDLTETLFNVRIVPWDTETWHESVHAYEMLDGDEVIGRFYLDMHPREGKFNHAAAFTMQSGVKGHQLPIVSLVCNFPGGEGSSGYMEHSDVKTFLHEFGHLLHAIFGGHQRWLSMSGVRTEWDFVEAPAQMLEEWVWDAETLSKFARNARGETIPVELVERMNAGRDFGRGLFVQHQMFYAALSLNLYNRDPEGLDLTETVRELQEQYSPFPYVEDTYFHTAFGHLYGYSAIYYTYMWSLVIAQDMFSEFEEHGMLNTEVAQRYRDKVLAPGGSRDAADLVEDFLGRPYSFDAFARRLEDK